MCYILWFDSEKPPPVFWRHDAIHVAKTTRQARKIIEKHGFPLIASFGTGSIDFVKELSLLPLPIGFTFRVHNERMKMEVSIIMRKEHENRNTSIEYDQCGASNRRNCMEA